MSTPGCRAVLVVLCLVCNTDNFTNIERIFKDNLIANAMYTIWSVYYDTMQIIINEPDTFSNHIIIPPS